MRAGSLGLQAERTTTVTMKAALVLFALGSGVLGGLSLALAEMVVTDVAYVASVKGRAVALTQGKPTLLEELDIIDEWTRLEILANSELRLCHNRDQRLLTLKGPLRVSVSAYGVTAENGQQISGPGERCVKPAVSTFQGGSLVRSVTTESTPIALRPSIKIVNRGAIGVRSIALWDGEQRRIVVTFERGMARPTLDEGQFYFLVVGRNDGSQLKMKLIGSKTAETGPLIFVVR
jgi:hypothetical protein